MGKYKNQEYRKLKQRIISVRNPVLGTRRFFGLESTETIKKYSNALFREPFFKKTIIGKCCPSAIMDIGSCGNMPVLSDFEKALIWTILGFSAKVDQLNKFLQFRSRYDQAFILGKYGECLQILDESHSLFGYSLWEIKNRIAVLSELEGLESQRTYANTTREKLQSGGIPAYLVTCASKQCERNVSVSTYLKDVQADYEYFLSADIPVAMCKYVKFMANGYVLADIDGIDFLDSDTLSYFLYFNDKLSLIDRYLSFCKILNLLFSHKSNTLCDLIAPYITNLSNDIDDVFLGNIVFEHKNRYCCFRAYGNEDICVAFDLYSTGEYAKCASLADSLIRSNISYFPLVELFSKCCMYSSEITINDKNRCVYETLSFRFKQLFSRQGDIDEVQSNIVKTIYTQLDSPWAATAFHILKKYNHRFVVLERTKDINYHLSVSLPDCIFAFDKELLPEFLSHAPLVYTRSLSVQLSVAVCNANVDAIKSLPIEHIRRNKYLAYVLVENNPKAALTILENSLEDISVGAIQQEFDALRIKACLRLNRLLNAMEIFVPAFQNNANFIHIGYIDLIFERIKHGDQSVYGSILTPIICSLYFNYYPLHDDRDDIVLNMCYDDYLESCKVSRPSELLSNTIVDCEEANAIRFLAEVCVPNVMDRSLSFSSYDEVLRERIVICDALIDFDPDFAPKYKAEIERLTKTLLVRLAKRKVENSKIYVDNEGIRTLLIKEICEPYERYLDYRHNNITEQVYRVLNVINGNSTDSAIIINISPDKMLESIAKRVRDIYVADNKYGLDGCLSVRIRHGTLESQLRSCFEKHKLITTKASNGEYKANRTWCAENTGAHMQHEELFRVFADFSSKIDELISYVKKCLIQIKTEDRNQEGLFDFTMDSAALSWLEHQLYANTSFENFMGCILDLLSTFTEQSLTVVRKELQTKINEAFQKALQNLEIQLEQYEPLLNFQALRTSIANARTDISTELNSISEWFRLTQPEGFSDYELALAATISCDIIQYSHSLCGFQCVTDSIDNGISLKGATLPNVVDIFKILLDNVIKHSGLSEIPAATISGIKSNHTVIITVENPVLHGSVDIKNLEKIESQLNDWESQGHINTEGGSGLHKIKKILSIDMNCNNSLHLNCKDDVFSVVLTIDVEGILL